MVARGWKEGRMEFRVSLKGDENVDFKIDCGDGCTIHRYTKNYQIIHFKWLSFMVCELYLSLLFLKMDLVVLVLKLILPKCMYKCTYLHT